MRRRTRRLGLLTLLAAISVAAWGHDAGRPLPAGIVSPVDRTQDRPTVERDVTALEKSVATADRTLIERLFRETGAERQLAAPSWNEYAATIATAIAARIGALFGELDLRSALWPRVLAWVLLATLGVILATLLARWLLRVWRSRQPRSPAPATVTLVCAGGGAEPRRSPQAWRAEIDARLGLHQLDAALEAVWWWFASSLCESPVDPSWTSRELLQNTRRNDLRPQAALLDRMIYGPARPRADEVRGLVRRMEAALS
jgi:hypothetical protein